MFRAITFYVIASDMGALTILNTKSNTKNLEEARRGNQCIAQMLELYPRLFTTFSKNMVYVANVGPFPTTMDRRNAPDFMQKNHSAVFFAFC